MFGIFTKIPVPEVIKAWYFFIRFEIIDKVIFLIFITIFENCNVKPVCIARILARVTIIVKGAHQFADAAASFVSFFKKVKLFEINNSLFFHCFFPSEA